MTDADLLWKLIAIVSVCANPVSVWLSNRRRPSVPEELYRDFATKNEVQQLRSEFLKTAGEIFDVTRKLSDSTATAFRELSASVNRVEGVISEHCRKER